MSESLDYNDCYVLIFGTRINLIASYLRSVGQIFKDLVETSVYQEYFLHVVCAQACAHILWRTEENLQESDFSFHPVSSENLFTC